MTYSEALAYAKECAEVYGEVYVVVLRADGNHSVDNARCTNPAMVVETVSPVRELPKLSPLALAIAQAQQLADLYGLTYGVYERQDGSFMHWPGDPAILNPVQKIGECYPTYPIWGAARLDEEVEAFLNFR